MQLKIKCVYCNKSFNSYSEYIQVRGTRVSLSCPHCNKQSVSNFSRFCEDQVGAVDSKMHKARLMVQLSRVISKRFNDDYKK